LGCHHVTVGLQRKSLEKAGELQPLATTLGADGKTYTRAKLTKPTAPATTNKAPPPASMDKLVAAAFSPLVRKAQREGRIEELAGALQRYADRRLGAKAPDTGIAASPVVYPDDNEPSDALARRLADERQRRAAEVNAKCRPPMTLRDVRHDIAFASITPVAPDDDGDLPTEERVADRAALQRHRDGGDTAERDVSTLAPSPSDASNETGMGVPAGTPVASPESESFWESGTVVHFHATRCGKVRIQGVGDYPFDQRTLANDFIPRVGLQVSCLLRERQGYFGGVQLLKMAPEVPA
jgi:hypothetical protein